MLPSCPSSFFLIKPSKKQHTFFLQYGMVCLEACRKGLRTTEDVELVMRLLSGCDWTGSRPPAKEELRTALRSQGSRGRNCPLANDGPRAESSAQKPNGSQD